ncbi:MAG TPA: vWA domain-containing protein [Bryobacteraceae bacterium]|nr:vWA domain-containing protein [Bryobacteraceae bacterium]
MSRIAKIVKKDPKRRGFIILTHALMLFVTIAMIGLAVDAGTMYVIKGRLSSAVDAAALAAGRSVNLGSTVAAASVAATTTATQFFNANFPNGYLGTGTMNLSPPTFTQETDSNGNPTGYLDIAVNASVPAPTYFMQIFGIRNVNVSGTGTATRRGTVMILVLDISTSMNSGSPTACSQMKAAAQQFITNFSPYDTIGVVEFTFTADVLYPPSTNFGNGTLNTALGNINCTNNTNTTSGLWLAYEQIKSVGLPLAYNSIVLFTDGSPNGISANFPVRTQADTRYGQDYTQGICTSTGTPCAMPVICSGAASQTVRGTIPQGAGQTNTGGTSGLYQPINTDPAISYPAACNSSASGAYIRQMVAYIPDFDVYGNSTHGVPATSTPPNCPGATCGVANVTLKSTGATYYYDTRDFWEFQANNLCSSPSGSAVAPCSARGNNQPGGGVWSSFPGGSGSNFFTAGPYVGYMRPDQPTTIVAATMNTAMSESYWIRADSSGCGGSGGNGTVCPTLYHPVINTIYLLGNATDAADHEFLSIMSNTQQIIALPYDNPGYVPYTNPAYQQHQESGLYQVTASPSQLTVLFGKLADEVLRLSH